MPLFSVIMPVYNSEKTLKKSIDSLFCQTIQDFELIAVNDGSTDGSLNILSEYAKEHPNVIVINQKNAGPGVARNNGIRIASGEYISFLDADDYWSKDFFEEVLRVSNNRKVDYIYVEMIKETSDGKVIAKSNVAKNIGISKQQMICRQITGKMPWGMSKVIKKSVINQCGGKFLELTVGEENIFSFEALKASNSIAFTEKVIYHYLQSPQGQHTKGDFDPWNSLVSSFKDYLEKTDEISEYESTINSLALKAMSISFYRYSNGLSFAEARRRIKESYREYKQNYNFHNINIDALDNTTMLIKRLVEHRLIGFIILASRYRSMKQV